MSVLKACLAITVAEEARDAAEDAAKQAAFAADAAAFAAQAAEKAAQAAFTAAELAKHAVDQVKGAYVDFPIPEIKKKIGKKKNVVRNTRRQNIAGKEEAMAITLDMRPEARAISLDLLRS